MTAGCPTGALLPYLLLVTPQLSFIYPLSMSATGSGDGQDNSSLLVPSEGGDVVLDAAGDEEEVPVLAERLRARVRAAAVVEAEKAPPAGSPGSRGPAVPAGLGAPQGEEARELPDGPGGGLATLLARLREAAIGAALQLLQPDF